MESRPGLTHDLRRTRKSSADHGPENIIEDVNAANLHETSLSTSGLRDSNVRLRQSDIGLSVFARLLRGLPIPVPSLVFAASDVVIGHYGEDYKNPHREGAHSGDGFRDQARQKHPSTAED